MLAVPGSSQTNSETGIRVVVTPAQSSYFAGEPFSVTVTFTNTRQPATTNAPRPSISTHKRAAHSISSAPLARPPTSPRTPRAPTPVYAPSPLSRPQNRTSSRKGLIGKRSEEEEEAGVRSRQLSLSIDLRRQILEGGPKSATVESPRYNIPEVAPRHTPEAPRLNARSHTLPLSSTHPHARKQSVLDGQVQLPDITASPSTPNLDTISETSPSLAKAFVPRPSIAESTSAGHLAPLSRHPAKLGLGLPSPSNNKLPLTGRSSFSTTFPQPNTELVLYSYAQLSGTVHVAPDSTVQTQELRALRASLKRSGAIGGGNMNILSPNPIARRRPHSRSASLSASASGLISSLLASSPNLSPSVSANARLGHRSTGSASFPSLPSAGSLIAAAPADIEDVDPTQPLPTLDVQPAMLAVDLSLLPGESRKYTYTLPLPANLPPTFRGRNLRFSYELVIGVCRAGAAPGAGGVSRVMKVPIRLYNNVSVGRIPRPYDLLWPVGRRIARDENGKVREEVDHALRRPSPKLPGQGEKEGSIHELKEYAKGLAHGVTDSPELSLILGRPARWKSNSEMDTDEDASEKVSSCREAVEILTRTPKKASYDVNKDNVKVAVLTFTKSAYRLGETVLGVVEVNARDSRSRVLQLSAFLESHETLPHSLQSPSTPPHRRLHAEHHASFVLSTLRATFALDIPSDGSPAFDVSAGGYPLAPGGLQWKVRLCLLVAVAANDADQGTEGVRLKSLVRDGPRGEWGSAWSATEGIAPLVREPQRARPPTHRAAPSWGYGLGTLTAALLGSGTAEGEGEGDKADVTINGSGEYDGIKPDPAGGVGMGVNFGGKEDGWRPVRVETVECELPIKVWPGNTAFKALDVVFDV
ncbi:Rgp1-domain-containing protein [Schizophyllum commune Loenen D]|nr:Rgp1-domain-containing protein [Schizophyllum commune Loenen D]